MNRSLKTNVLLAFLIFGCSKVDITPTSNNLNKISLVSKVKTLAKISEAKCLSMNGKPKYKDKASEELKNHSQDYAGCELPEENKFTTNSVLYGSPSCDPNYNQYGSPYYNQYGTPYCNPYGNPTPTPTSQSGPYVTNTDYYPYGTNVNYNTMKFTVKSDDNSCNNIN